MRERLLRHDVAAADHLPRDLHPRRALEIGRHRAHGVGCGVRDRQHAKLRAGVLRVHVLLPRSTLCVRTGQERRCADCGADACDHFASDAVHGFPCRARVRRSKARPLKPRRPIIVCGRGGVNSRRRACSRVHGRCRRGKPESLHRRKQLCAIRRTAGADSAATSRKYATPMSGVLMTSARAVAVCGLLKACTSPGGVAMSRPPAGRASRCRPCTAACRPARRRFPHCRDGCAAVERSPGAAL